ncbi:MAG: FecR family protein [Gammaproteobacteria bacterium]|nr:FecR family protein [Gammaproteobacteria bacterium]
MRNPFIRVCLGVLLVYVPPAIAEIEIEHRAPAVAIVGERISLSAVVKDDSADIGVVRAYFRTLNTSDYLYAEMPRAAEDAQVYAATLPAPAHDTQQIDYFLLVKNTAGEVVKSQNFDIDISPSAAQASYDQRPRGNVVVEPSEFATVNDFHGRMLRLSGNVEIMNSYGEKHTPAETGFVVRKHETVRTGSNSVVVIDFDKDPITVLDSDSQLNVRAPTWLSHLAGTAYFAFQRLLGVSQSERVVNNTVALIGIRGTTFISYDEAKQGVALKEGSLRIARSRPRPMSLLRNGVAQTTNEFTLGPDRMAMFQGARVAETEFTRTVLADFTRLEAFAAGLLGAPQTAQQPRMDVYSEAPPDPSQLAGFDDFITLRPTPPVSALGISAATSTVVASASARAAGTSAWLLAGAGAGALAVAAGTGGGGGNGSSSGASGGTSTQSNFVADVDLSCNTCGIAFIDTNSIQDDYYDLYVNDVLVGPVNLVPGGRIVHTVNLLSGANTMELRFSAVQCCNTDLEADFNNGEAVTPFSGSTDHVWTINAP